MSEPIVVIIAGSRSDEAWVEKIIAAIRDSFPTAEIQSHYASAHREPRIVLELVDSFDDKRHVVFITVAGRSNALSGVVAANTEHVVIACPPLETEAAYLVDIHSSLRMPSGVPVLTILGWSNCGLVVGRLLKSWKS